MLKLNKAQLACVDFNSTIKEVIKSFEQSKLKICFMCFKNFLILYKHRLFLFENHKLSITG